MTTYSILFRNHTLLKLGIAESISSIGNWITIMAVFSRLIFKEGGDTMQSSGVLLAGLLPILIFSPLAGWLCDRFDRKRLMIIGEALSGLSILGLALTNQLFWTYALLAIQSIFIAIVTPARQASIPTVVERENLVKANSLLQQLAGIIKIIAPSLAGLILTFMTPNNAILFSAFILFAGVFILTRLPALLPQTQVDQTETGNKENAPISPLRALAQLPQLQILFVAVFLSVFVIVGFDVLASIFTRDVLGGQTELFGLLISLVGVGTLLATIYIMRQNEEVNYFRYLITGIILLAIIPFTSVVAVYIPDQTMARFVMLAGCLIGGAGNGLLLVQSATILQIYSPAAVLGRISGLYQSVLVAGQLSGMILPPLLVPAHLSLAGYLGIAAIGLLIVAFYARLATRKLNNVVAA